MASSKGSSRRQTGSGKPDNTPAGAPQDAPEHLEAEDGIMFRIREEHFTIASEPGTEPQKIPGYSISIAIPNWSMNGSLLNDIRKGFHAQSKMIAKLQTGADRQWLMARFVELDKAMASSLSRIAERIRTRRWRKSDRDDSLARLKQAFERLQKWIGKTIGYCEYMETCSDHHDSEMALDAACLSILKVGELINQVERMQRDLLGGFQRSALPRNTAHPKPDRAH